MVRVQAQGGATRLDQRADRAPAHAGAIVTTILRAPAAVQVGGTHRVQSADRGRDRAGVIAMTIPQDRVADQERIGRTHQDRVAGQVQVPIAIRPDRAAAQVGEILQAQLVDQVRVRVGIRQVP